MPIRVEFEELAEEVQTAVAALALQLRVRHPAFIHVQLTWNGVANEGIPIVDVVTALDAPVPGPPALYVVPDLPPEPTRPPCTCVGGPHGGYTCPRCKP